jgi:fluoride exporter
MRRMSAQLPEANRSLAGRRLLIGLTAATGAAAVLWRWLMEQTPLVRETGAILANLDAKALSLYLWIWIGSGLGGVTRFWCSGVAARLAGETFPWGTIAINVVGSFIIGFVAMLTGPDGRIFVSSTARQFVMVGFCGGFTTFSSFSLQTLNLMRSGEWLSAAGNVGASVVLCLVSVWAGYALAASLSVVE